jgi:hypothetical protein
MTVVVPLCKARLYAHVVSSIDQTDGFSFDTPFSFVGAENKDSC